MNRCAAGLLAVSLSFVFSCGKEGNSADPFAKVELLVSVYDGNTPTSIPKPITGTAATSKSNRPVIFAFNNLNTLNKTDSLVTKLEVTRVINGVSTTCVQLDDTGAVMSGLTDWAAASTEYTFKLSGATASRTIGPITITVEPAGRVVTGGHALGDQTNDAITSGGSFFQTRTFDIGAGGYTGVNFNTVLAHQGPRLLDFQTVSAAGQMKAISPSDINTTNSFPLLKNDCGFQTTTFAAYTGPLDPKAAPLTQAEITALPSPPAGATSIPLSLGLKFVYQTSDGKKGLILVDTLSAGSAGLDVSAEQ